MFLHLPTEWTFIWFASSMEILTDKKKAIFESTLALVKEHGFHGTPMSQIAKNAGVAAGTIYHHFESKDTLIIELYSYIRQKMLQALLQDDNQEMNFKDWFFNFWLSHCLFYIQNPTELYFMEQFINSPYSSRDTFTENELFQNTFRDLVKTGVENGDLKQINFRILCSLVHGSVVNASKIQLCRKINITEEELHQIAGVVWDGIKNNELSEA